MRSAGCGRCVENFNFPFRFQVSISSAEKHCVKNAERVTFWIGVTFINYNTLRSFLKIGLQPFKGRARPEIPYLFFNRLIGILWSMVSKAADKAKRTRTHSC